ncbi:MAG: inorganic phosphate transporter [Bacteroidales bacterium]|nr:inorganic phosphate transporter [Bacteroidales bacterium]
METFYLIIVVILFMLAIFDLIVGVSNDAVNFLNSAIGAKAASFKTIMVIAALGIFVGATFSNGMMDIARHGIYQPEYFYFEEIMCILLAVMLTDVVLLDFFNSLGLPTSTTVSMVFELLGGTFALALLKTTNDPSLDMSQLINTDKALSVIMAIFVSVAIAFFFGLVVQYISRMIFSFSYQKKLKYFIGVFGGFSATAIIYYMFLKGLKDATFITSEAKLWVNGHISILVPLFFIASTLLMQMLHWMKVNVFRIIVFLGTFALALAFAGNDLVNFIGVPLAGYSSYLDFINTPGATPDTLLMTSLTGSANTPWYFLVGAGVIMVVTLVRSKKAQAVVKTSVDLSRQDEGEESFGSTPMARSLVRVGLLFSGNVNKIVPESAKQWIETRFRKEDAILANGAAFDLVRASVNLVLAGSLIALGTSLKLPLSTTYVTFMVAMGTSLADRAWSRDSAVYRITGVLSVIGGWFITAGAAFTICMIFTAIIHYGGAVAIFVMIFIAVFLLVRSQIIYKKKNQKEKNSMLQHKELFSNTTKDPLTVFREYTYQQIDKLMGVSIETFDLTISSFIKDNLRGLRQASGKIKFAKQHMKQVRRVGTVAVSNMENSVTFEKGLFYQQGSSFATEVLYSISRICEPCYEHVDNNFTPLRDQQKDELKGVSDQILALMKQGREIMFAKNYDHFDDYQMAAESLNKQLGALRREELTRIRQQKDSIKMSMVYLTTIQELQSMVSNLTNLLKVCKRFQDL